MRFLLIAFTILSSSVSAHAQTKKLVLVGDSLTEGFGVSRERAYPALLQQKIDRAGKRWRVINSGISGSTAASAASRVEWVLKQKPHLIILALGANDGLRGTPVKNIEENLGKAITIAQKAGVKIILAGIKLPPNYGKAYTGDFWAIYPRLSKRFGVPLIPFLLDRVAGQPDLNLADGIHPNEKGHAIVAETVFRAIEKLL